MQVISTNLANPETIIWQGKKVKTGIYKKPVKQPIMLELTDVASDSVIDRRYHGGIDKACYLFSANHYQGWKALYPKLNWDWGMFGENLTISNLDESETLIGDVYRLGKALVQVTQPRQPCFKLGVRLGSQTTVKKFIEMEQPGAYVKVLEPGFVQLADTMELIERTDGNMSLKQVFHLVYNAKENLDLVKQALAMASLAESCRIDLIKNAQLSV